MVDVSSSDFDYRRDCREDTEAQNPPKCELAPEGYPNIPEQDHWNGYNCCFEYIV